MRERDWQLGYWNAPIVYSTKHLSWMWLGFWKICGRNSLWIKLTDALNSNFYWYYDSTCFGQPFCPSSGVLRLHWYWYILCSFDYRCYQFDDSLLPGVGCSILLLVANGHQIGSNNHQNCIKCTNADVRLRTADYGQKGCPKHVES